MLWLYFEPRLPSCRQGFPCVPVVSTGRVSGSQSQSCLPADSSHYLILNGHLSDWMPPLWLTSRFHNVLQETVIVVLIICDFSVDRFLN